MKRKRLVVGLTGGIGSGKSTALKEFARLGAKTVSSDEIAREQAAKGGAAYAKIVKAFGRSILDDRRRIDRGSLAKLAFSNSGRRRRLERLTHPLIIKEMRRRIA